jgi:hypothetical protein
MARKKRESKYFRPQKDSDAKKCDFPGCDGEGLYRAPKNRNLKEYYWFCLEHVREYNSNWNYYANMSETEIENQIKHDTVWQRPTWKMGDGGSNHFNGGIKDPFGVFEDIESNTGTDGKDRPFNGVDNPEEDWAFKILDLVPPTNNQEIRKKYKELAKKYHPDVTGGDKFAEEKFKDVSKAYKLLMDKWG